MDCQRGAYVPPTDKDPKALFDKTALLCNTVKQRINEKEQGLTIVRDAIIHHLSHAVYGSNHIERVGLGLSETVSICNRAFHGEMVDLEDIPDGESYQIIQRREVIQHALALQHITTEMVANRNPLSEVLILETHRILTEKIDAGGTSWKSYSGRYRHIPVSAGATNFVAPRFVPQKMKELIEEFNADIEQAKISLDPFTLAAKYCNDFVMIHPFIDGNGRMCRLILNAILLKYAGVVVSIGEDDQERQEYLDIQRRAGEQMEGSGELAFLVLRKAMGRYRTMKKKL
ncbi:hypothetical protein ASPWEDRAFT_55475 [Aspergillus wentii DTO 134E9]|uniref:Fido domain-containing protein n=1 Tax=Aspergillus wentii DTO 134E9 TaxID=1073089 RepID=A0A1L9R4Y2_ASPWE|nr:uncharacterized protein ASPWEDRAFT_55475 [Aspergillus wentii DTO 134E9]OJJ29976.1 hypothetical protein ASPWEDRAFT_55475 [Aspergillus wentii DTO 134E9]